MNAPLPLLLIVTIVAVILYRKLRSVPAPPRCVECNLDMEFDTELPWLLAGPGQSPVGAGVHQPDLRMQQFHCPRCGRQRRVSR